MSSAFSALSSFNFRLWAAGSLVSNVGTWFQRIAQDWLVLTELTNGDAVAVGVVMALQTAPTVLLLPITGYAVDRFDRRKLMIVTQALLCTLAFSLGLLVVSGLVQLWHVYVLAFLFGCVTAFDSPARQVFAPELVGETDLAQAVAMNSTIFNVARLVGPALAGVLIATMGSAGGFFVNAASFAASLGALCVLRVNQLHQPRERRPSGGLAEGFRYIRGRPDLRAVLVMTFLIGAFGLNFPIFISTMSVKIFHGGADQYGLFTTIMAFGSIAGALLVGKWRKPGIAQLLATVAVFAVGFAMAALSPGFWMFAFAMVVLGLSSVGFTTASSSFSQLATAPEMRGRVMAIRLAVGMGCTPIGAPVVGWIANAFGPRWAGAVGAAAGLIAMGVAIDYLVRHRNLRGRLNGLRLQLTID